MKPLRAAPIAYHQGKPYRYGAVENNPRAPSRLAGVGPTPASAHRRLRQVKALMHKWREAAARRKDGDARSHLG